jgi:polysaccharide biosynthesis/export protein
MLNSLNRSSTTKMKTKSKMHWLLIAWLLVATGFAQQLPQVKKTDESKPAASEPATVKPATPGLGQAVDPRAYLIGGEDVLQIQTWRHPEFSFTMAVRPDGKIAIPLVGEMQAGGLTPDQLTKQFSAAIADYVKSPEVFIQVLEVRSKKYFIDGEVGRAGEYPLIGPTRVFEALSKAGGFRDFANKKKIQILRGDKVFKFNWTEVSKGKKLEQNILLENGDHIIVN